METPKKIFIPYVLLKRKKFQKNMKKHYNRKYWDLLQRAFIAARTGEYPPVGDTV